MKVRVAAQMHAIETNRLGLGTRGRVRVKGLGLRVRVNGVRA